MIMTIGKVILCLLSVVIIVAVMLQKPKEAGAGSSFGGSSNYINSMKSQTSEAKLARITKITGVIFAVASLALVIIQKFMA